MSQSPHAEENGPAGLGGPKPEGRMMLLDDKQWSYLRKRYELTPREKQIAELVCQGLRTGNIARHLNIQPGTVKTHVRNIYRKVKVKNKINMLLRFVTDARGLSAERERTHAPGLLE
jgi:DNA-binding NarL/FixJ family response regulator